MTTTEVDLQERRRQLTDRLTELRIQAAGIQADLATAESDWLTAVEQGDDAGLLAERCELHKRELANSRHAIDHITAVMAGVDAEIAAMIARQRLALDIDAYADALATFRSSLAGVSAAPTQAVDALVAALTALSDTVEHARRTGEALTARATELRTRAAELAVDTDLADPPGWSNELERETRGTALWGLVLCLLQSRGDRAILNELASLAWRKRLGKE